MLAIALRMLWRDWRGGELGVLLAALVIAVAVVAGISAFTTRLQHSLEQQSHRLLGADRVVAGARAQPAAWQAQAVQLGLRSARTLSFPSMLYSGADGLYLASVKAVSSSYPLRGELLMSTGDFADAGSAGSADSADSAAGAFGGEVQRAPHGPAPGTVWLDARLFALLQLQLGDRVMLGDAGFTVAAVLRDEPDRGSSLFDYGPRVLMHLADIPRTGVVQPGSRVRYRLLLAGAETALQDYIEWLQPQLPDDQRLLEVGDGQQGIARALARAETFLLLAGSLGVVLAGVAIALAARRFSERHYDYVAILKSLGVTASVINRLYAFSLLLLGLVATALGTALGWALQALLFEWFAGALPLTPGSSGLRPWLIGAATASTCLLAFAWPPLARLGGASPLRVLQRAIPHDSGRGVLDSLIGLGAVLLLMLWYSGDVQLTLAVLAGLAAAAGLAALGAVLLLRGGRLVGMRAGSIWRLALAGLQRHGAANTLQLVVFALVIMLLLIAVLVRTSLVEEWQTQLPPGTPNHFLLNIAPAEVGAVRRALQDRALLTEPLYAVVRGRLTHINDEPLAVSDDRQSPRREREINLTWSAAVPPGNALVAGSWWAPDSSAPLVSLEQEIAERLQVQVGDQLRYVIGARTLQATVASIRRLDWQSMRPNFFMVLPPAVLQGYPATFMTSFHLPAADKRFLNELVRRFPTVTVVELDVVIARVRSIIEQVSAAIELVLLVILTAGGLVLIAGVQASVDARLLEGAILRALGARRGLILGGLVIEFAALGLCAGLLATLAAEIAAFVLQTQVLDMAYRPHPQIWLSGPALAVLLIGGLGVWNCRRVVSSPPILVLREL